MSTALVDRFGRTADDLRVSLTDKCNLRCTYCMPAHGMTFLPGDELLTRDEIVRLVALAVERFGVRQVRLTGGEPLIRSDLLDIIADLSALPTRPELSMTTNGIGLSGKAEALREAGLDRINVSLDSLCAETFQAITRRPFLDRVLAGIDALVDSGYRNIKVNTVLLAGVNDHEAPELLEWALAHGHQLRFIEQMPLDADGGWDRETMVTAERIRELLAERFVLEPGVEPRDGAPAELFQVRRRGGGAGGSPGATSGSGSGSDAGMLGPRALGSGGEAVPALGPRALDPGLDAAVLGTVGIIASVTEPFCADCRRTRLTAEGSVRSCLFSHTETDLRGALRSGADDDELETLWRRAMWAKPRGHGMERADFRQPARTMSAIGG